MQFRKFGNTGFDISALSFGAMRLPTTDNVQLSAAIDDKEAIKMMRLAIDSGVNYLDTAHMYHGGKSEEMVGRALKDGYRNKTKIATKSPVFYLKDANDFDAKLEEQLKRLDVDFIDFYLFHSLNANYWDNVVLKFDLIHKIEKAKKDGKIGHIGFSFHGEFVEFERILNEYNKFEFCQIQLNYLNENYQAGLKGLELAAQKGLGVVIMEPLLGGRLASPKAEIVETFKKANAEKDVPEWALDYLWDKPAVSTVLSGMSTVEQIEGNVSYASKSSVNMLTTPEKATIVNVINQFEEIGGIPCTKCSYCMPCPVGVDIPQNFEIYNETFKYNTIELTKAKYASHLVSEQGGKLASTNCIKCRACESKCPQNLKIADLLQKVTETLA